MVRGSNAGWITLTGAASGTGNGSVPYSVAANTRDVGAQRNADGRRADVHGESGGAACSYAISPTSQSVAAAGGTGSTTSRRRPGVRGPR